MSTLRNVVASRHNAAALADVIESDLPVVGYLDSGFPEELAMAAGLRPMLLTGDLSRRSPAVDDLLDAAVPGRVRALLSGMVEGSYGDLTSLCVTGGDSWLAGVDHYLTSHEVLTGRRIYPDVWFLQRVRGRYRHHREYVLEELRAYREHLRALTGNPLDDDAIRVAIAEVNLSRELIRELSALRHRESPRIGGVDAQTIVLAGMIMPKAEFNLLLREVLDTGLDEIIAPEPGRPRVFVSGTGLDHTGLHELIEAAGAVVVGEDNEFGERYALTVVDETIDPLEALADRIALGFPEPWSFGREKRIRMKVELAIEARPDAEIYFHVKGDQGVGWDFPDQRRALESAMRVFPLIDQEYALPRTDSLTEQVAGFVDVIDRRNAA